MVRDRQVMNDELETLGFTVARGAIEATVRAGLLRLCETETQSSVRHKNGAAFAARGLLESVPELRDALTTSGMTTLAARHFGDGAAVAIDALFFDKRSDVNWAVPGHQDRWMPAMEKTTRTSRRVKKHGIEYAEPSSSVLRLLVSLRLHFDDCDETSGALQVVPGTHGDVIAEREIPEISLARYRPCRMAAGDVMIMKPLLLHRSSPSTSSKPRRVLHVVYAPL